MSKFTIPVFLVLILVTTGCATATPHIDTKMESTQTTSSPILKNVDWCSEREKSVVEKDELWVSSEFFNGMQHGPTIQHVCLGREELFYLQMEWDDKASVHAGKLIAVNSSSTYSVSSTHKDPEFKLLEVVDTQNSDRVSASIDGKIVVYDKKNKNFTDSVTTETSSEAHLVYHIYIIAQKQNAYVMTVASTTMFGGETAIRAAMDETDCKSEDILSCAGSLNNNFYISKKMSKKFSVSLPADAPIVILQRGVDPVEITSEHFYNLFTQTDAFVMGDNWTPFIIEIENGTVLKIDQQYIP